MYFPCPFLIILVSLDRNISAYFWPFHKFMWHWEGHSLPWHQDYQRWSCSRTLSVDTTDLPSRFYRSLIGTFQLLKSLVMLVKCRFLSLVLEILAHQVWGGDQASTCLTSVPSDFDAGGWGPQCKKCWSKGSESSNCWLPHRGFRGWYLGSLLEILMLILPYVLIVEGSLWKTYLEPFNLEVQT